MELTMRKKKKNYLKGHTLMKNNKLNFIYILHYMLYSYKQEPLPQMRTFFLCFSRFYITYCLHEDGSLTHFFLVTATT